MNTLLTELDSSDRATTNSVHVIAASNRPESIDPAILRAGRLGKHLYVGLPSAAERKDILATILRDMPMDPLEMSSAVEWAAKESEERKSRGSNGGCDGFSGADLEALCREAAQVAVERDSDMLELRDLQEAIQRGVKASVAKDEVERWRRLKLA